MPRHAGSPADDERGLPLLLRAPFRSHSEDRRDFCVAALREIPGVTVPEPSSAFYVFPRIDGLEGSVASAGVYLSSIVAGSGPAPPSEPVERGR